MHDIMPGTEELLNKEMVSGYIGFDPTSDSLGVGNLVQIMILLHFQKAGHKPIALIGGATGMVGDPSGKSLERNLLDEETLTYNQACQKKQLEKFYVADFICYNLIILELKALSNLTPQHEAQVINYLKATGIKLGLLINFGEPSLKYKRLLL